MEELRPRLDKNSDIPLDEHWTSNVDSKHFRNLVNAEMSSDDHISAKDNVAHPSNGNNLEPNQPGLTQMTRIACQVEKVVDLGPLGQNLQ